MQWDFETTDDVFCILPELLLQAGVCENPECEETHFELVIGWGKWHLNIYFE